MSRSTWTIVVLGTLALLGTVTFATCGSNSEKKPTEKTQEEWNTFLLERINTLDREITTLKHINADQEKKIKSLELEISVEKQWTIKQINDLRLMDINLQSQIAEIKIRISEWKKKMLMILDLDSKVELPAKKE